jgi:hypothetical protein
MRTATKSGRGVGRHRRGVPQTAVVRAHWDVRQRAAAATLALTEPGWLIFCRPWARDYVAVARWDVPHGGMVKAGTPTQLTTLMRQAETAPASRTAGGAL